MPRGTKPFPGSVYGDDKVSWLSFSGVWLRRC